MRGKGSFGSRVLRVLLAPVLLLLLILLLLVLPFYLVYRLLLRIAVELVWGLRGRRILLVYSRSPIWQEYVETNWLPRLGKTAVVLNWSDRSAWRRRDSLTVWVFRHWAPSRNFNPMALLFPPLRPTRQISFYRAFHDWKQGKIEALRVAESELFSFAKSLE